MSGTKPAPASKAENGQGHTSPARLPSTEAPECFQGTRIPSPGVSDASDTQASMLAMGAQEAAAQLRALAAAGGGSGGGGGGSQQQQQPPELLHLVFHREVVLDVPSDQASTARAHMHL